jgi:hypothetical protein
VHSLRACSEHRSAYSRSDRSDGPGNGDIKPVEPPVVDEHLRRDVLEPVATQAARVGIRFPRLREKGLLPIRGDRMCTVSSLGITGVRCFRERDRAGGAWMPSL